MFYISLNKKENEILDNDFNTEKDNADEIYQSNSKLIVDSVDFGKIFLKLENYVLVL